MLACTRTRSVWNLATADVSHDVSRYQRESFSDLQDYRLIHSLHRNYQKPAGRAALASLCGDRDWD